MGKFTGAGAAPQVALCAFGKHPGWNDHIDDIGMETDELIAAKRLLYVSGIGANIDNGAWAKLDAAQRIAGFDHTFVWAQGHDLLGGRIWASRDGKGRDKYPMVLCTHTSGVPLRWTIDQALPMLLRAGQRCAELTRAADVIATLELNRTALRQALPPTRVEDLGLAVEPAEITALAEHADYGPEQQGLYRVLYQIRRALAAYRSGAVARSPRPEQLRLPRAGLAVTDALSLYARFVLSQIDPASSVLLLATDQDNYVDVIVGEPGAAQLFCVLAGPRAVPLTSEIPYTIPPEFMTAAKNFLEHCRQSPEEPLPALP